MLLLLLLLLVKTEENGDKGRMRMERAMVTMMMSQAKIKRSCSGCHSPTKKRE